MFLTQKYLLDHNYIDSFIALQPHYYSYPSEVQFLKTLILRGEFSQAAAFLNEYYAGKEALYTLYKTKFSQLLRKPNQQQLRTLMMEELPGVASEIQYEELLRELGEEAEEISKDQKWSVVRGRYCCFETIVDLIGKCKTCRDQIQCCTDDLETVVEEYYAKRGGEYQNQSRVNKSSDVKESYVRALRKNLMERSGRNGGEQSLEQIQGGNSRLKKSVGRQNKQQEEFKKSMRGQKNQQGQKNKNQKMKLQEIGKKSTILSRIEQNQKSSNKQKKPQQQKVTSPRVMSLQKSLSNNKSLLNDFNPFKEQNKFSFHQKLNQRNYSQIQKSAQKSKVGIAGKIIKYDNPLQLSEHPSLDRVRQNASQVIPVQKLAPNLSQVSKFKQNQVTSHVPINIHSSLQSDRYNIAQGNKYSYSQKISQRNKNIKQEINIQQIHKNIQQLQKQKLSSFADEDNQHFTFENDIKEVQQQAYTRRLLLSIRDAKAIRTCQWSSSGQLFAVGTNSSILHVFESLQQIYTIESLHSKSIFSLDWSHNEKSLLTCSNDQTIKITSFQKEFTAHKTTIIGQHDSCVRMALFSLNQQRVISCGDDSVIKVWDIAKSKKTVAMKCPASALALINNSIYAVGKDGVKMWDERTAQCVFTCKTLTELTYLTAQRNQVVCAHKDGQVSFLTPQLQFLHSVQMHEDEIRSLNSINDCTYITASFDGHTAIFSEKDAHIATYYKHNQSEEDKVVYATFMKGGFGYASTSTLGLCNVFALQ